MRTFKVVFKTLAIVVFVCVLDAIVTFALEPYGSKSDVVWSDYRQQSDIDLVFIGNSASAHAFDSNEIGSDLGENTFNLSTPGQLIDESYLALKSVVEEQRPNAVVYGFDFCDLEGDEFPNPGRAFIRSKDKDDFSAWLADAAYCLSDSRCYAAKESINWLFPWLENHVKPSPSSISKNIEMKLSGETVYDAAAVNEKGWKYHGRGYGNIESRLDYNEGSSKIYSDVYCYDGFDERKLQTLATMCDYCKAQGVDFVVVAPPMPVFNIFDQGNGYFDAADQVKNLVEAHGGEYYDLNMAKPGLLNVEDTSLFADYQHLNKNGAAATSAAFTKIMKARAAGEDTSALFYTRDEYMAAHDYVDLLRVNCMAEDGAIEISANALASSEASLEYQMLVRNDADEAWSVVRDWSDGSSFDLAVSGHGSCDVRVNVRKQGSKSEYDRYRVVSVTY